MSDFKLVQLLNPIQMTITGTFTPRGAYVGSIDYSVGDQVSYNGSSYIMYSDAPAGTLPTDSTKWGLVAQKGATGPAGTNGANGADGADIYTGISAPSSPAPGDLWWDTDDVDGDIVGSGVESITAGTGISVDSTDPAHPIVTNTQTSAVWGAITGTLSSQSDLNTALSGKQATLVSATNIKTVNGTSILGSGDLVVSGGGGGQATYDKVIAADGTGDYTSLATGLTAATDNMRIFIKPGTYTLSANLAPTARGLKLYGHHQEDTIINMAAYRLTLTGNRIVLKDLSFTMTNNFVYIDNGTDYSYEALVEDCIFNCTPSSSGQRALFVGIDRSNVNRCKLVVTGVATSFYGIINNGAGSRVTNCHFDGTVDGADSQLCSATMIDNCYFISSNYTTNGNMLDLINTSYQGHSACTNCTFLSFVNAWDGAAISVRGDRAHIEGNSFAYFAHSVTGLPDGSTFVNNKVLGRNNDGNIDVPVTGSMCVVSGNFFGDPGGTLGSVTSVKVYGNNCSISSNTFRGMGVGIELATGATSNTVVANNGQYNSDGILDNGTTTIISANGIS